MKVFIGFDEAGPGKDYDSFCKIQKNEDGTLLILDAGRCDHETQERYDGIRWKCVRCGLVI